MCKVKVVEGAFTLGICSKAVLSEWDREANCVLACKTYPSSDMEVTLESI
jgi:CDP-4-dehydro-6-deoxyglucose reductase